MMEQGNTAANLAELLINDDGIRFLTVNGFSLKGSAYDRFRRLCTCVERDPDHPFSRHLQRVLRETFSIELPLCPQNCDAIWMQTARCFLEGSRVLSPDEWKSQLEILPPECSDLSPTACLDLHGLQIQATDWRTWKAEAEARLEPCLMDGLILSVSFSPDFQFEKTNLYRVERHLSGIEPNDQIWSAQLLYFLCDFCYRHGIRCRIDWSGDFDLLAGILQYVSKLTPIPNLLLRCKVPAADPLFTICELVMVGRMDRNDASGVPPVLFVGKQAT